MKNDARKVAELKKRQEAAALKEIYALIFNFFSSNIVLFRYDICESSQTLGTVVEVKSPRVFNFISDHCISRVDGKGHAPYRRSFLKKLILEIESAGDVVVDELYKQFAYYMTSFKVGGHQQPHYMA